MKIETLAQLAEAAMSRKSVVCNLGGIAQRMPAAFLMNMQGWVIHRRIQSGIYIYRSKPQKAPFKAKS